MGKLIYVSDDLEKRAKSIINEMGLKSQGIDVAILGMNKSKTIGKVKKASEETEILANPAAADNMIILYLYERAFDKWDDPTKDFMIRMLLEGVSYDSDKCKVVISKDAILEIPMGLYQKYGDEVVKKQELGLLTIQQIKDEDKDKKENSKKKKIKF